MTIKKIFLIPLLLLPLVIGASNGGSKKSKQQIKEVSKALMKRVANRNLPISKLNGDCWTCISEYLSAKKKLDLRLVSTYLNSLFFSTYFGECPKMRLQRATLPLFSAEIDKLKLQQEQVTSFLQEARIDTLVVRQQPEVAIAILKTLGAQVKSINLKRTAVTDEQLKVIFAFCPNLETLDLHGCEKLVFKGLDWSKLTKLSNLDLYGTKITDAGIVSILNSSTNLRVLSLSMCSNLTFGASDWNNLDCSKLKNLSELDLGVTNITDEEILRILSNVTNLSSLNLRKCTHLTFNVLDWVNKLSESNLKNLTDINCDDTKVTCEFYRLLLANCPKLKVFKYPNSQYEIRLEQMKECRRLLREKKKGLKKIEQKLNEK